ncbi:MAG: hypothetical protein IPL35_00950 [Sphingobacteriales bacterium]|nr:hypothetical protein [Sphingobacteriales bacterium]
MKRILLLYLAVVLTSLSATAQQYGNEWIDYTKTYHRFLSDHTGLIRIDYSTLSQLGIPLQGSNLKMYARGEEIPIYVSTDGTFGAQDYIEFYGEANDGYFDTQMFINPDYHFNPYRSFFSTKTAYYLTYSGGSNKRMAPTSNDVSNAGSPEPYFIHESIKQVTTLFNPGEGHRDATGVISHYAFFEKGEGRASTTIETSLQTAAQSTFDVDTKYKYTGAAMDASVRVRMCGAGQAIPAITNHFFKIKVNNQTYANESIFRWDVKNILFNMQTATLGTDKTSFYIQPRDSVYAVPNTNITFDLTTKVKLAYIRVDYPRLFNFDNQKSFLFNVEVPNEKYIEVVGFEGGSSPILYDLTAQRRLIPVVSNGVYKFKLQPGGATKHKLYIVNSTSNLVKQIPFNDFKTINFTNYQSASNQGNYLLISHPDLRTGAVDQVEQYRQYRASAEGGAFNAVAVNIEELYDQFSNGIRKHPMAIRNFVNFAIDKWGLDPKFVLLLGKSIQYQYLIENSTNPSIINFEQCLVPTFGHQPSDNLLVCPKLMHDYRPLCAVGRVPARTSDDVKNYLDKLKQYESLYITNCNDLSNRYWMNRLVHIASGANSFEMNTYLSHFVNYEQYATSPPASMNLAQTFSSSTAAIEPEPQFKQLFESGLNVIEYSGHSTINDEGYWDFDIARNPDQYSNQGKYPIVFSQSCFAGQIHDTQSKSISEEYVMDEQGGFICMLATLALSSPALMNEFTDPLFHNLYIDHYGESVGENIVHTIKEIFIPMGASNWEDVAVTSTEFTFCGDPAVRPYLWKNPEYLISGVTSYPNLQSNTTVDVACSGIQLNVNIDNLGKVQGTVQVKVIRVMPDGSQIEEINQVINSPDRSQTLTFNLPSRTDQGGLGVNDFIISINQNGAVTEDCYNNNQFFIDNVNLVSSGTGSQSLQIVGLQNSYCSDAGAVTLQGSPWGGTFTIDGVQSYVLYPSQISAGTHTIAYNYVDGGGCAYSVQQTVSIAAPPVATFDYIQNVCTVKLLFLIIPATNQTGI